MPTDTLALEDSPRARVWAFYPARRSGLTRDEALAFRRRLEAALHAGRGSGATVGIRIQSGPEPTLCWEAESIKARQWATRILFPAYDRHSWKPQPRRPSGQKGTSLWGRRIRSWPQPFRDSADGPTLLDVWASAFASLPPGLYLTIRARPLAPRRPSWWDVAPRRVEPVRLPSMPSGRPPASPASRDRTSSEAIRYPITWEMRVALTDATESLSPIRLGESALVLEHASRAETGNGIAFKNPRWLRPRIGPSFLVSEGELATFLPGPEFPCGGPDPPTVVGRVVLPLGRNGVGRVVGPHLDPDQGRHLAVLGETGMGKSSLLVSIARRVSQDHGLVVLDPLGTTAAAIKNELYPTARRRLLWIAPSDSPPRFNALEGIAPEGPRDPDPVRSERRLNDLVHSLRRVRSGRYTDSAYWGPRLEEMLTRALQAAAGWPEGTLVDAHTLLATGGRLHRDVPPATQGPVRELAQRIRERPEDAEGARRLLHEIVRSPVLEHMLCAPVPDLRSSELVRPGRVVLVSGDATRVGESTARYLLSVFLAIVWSELLSRATRAKTFLLLDEAQWFAHESLAEILRLGRFANVHVILATQAIASLPQPVAEAVWTNVADLVAFRGSPEEARELARSAHGISTEAVLSLPRGHAVVLLGKGETVHWLRTLRLPGRTPRSPGGETEGSPSDVPGDRRPEPPQPSANPAHPGHDGEPGSVSIPAAPPTGMLSSDRSYGRLNATSPEEVIDYLRAMATSVPTGDVFRVPLEDLRRRLDPSGLAVRQAGARLSAAGAIVGTERTGVGTVWTLSIDRFPPPTGSGKDDRPLGGSPPPQPS